MIKVISDFLLETMKARRKQKSEEHLSWGEIKNKKIPQKLFTQFLYLAKILFKNKGESRHFQIIEGRIVVSRPALQGKEKD